jgi:hypothetical protein
MAYTTIDDPSAHFQVTLYTGNSGDNAITNDGNSDLQPDWLWVKNRGDTQDHVVFDSSRGFNGDNDSLYLETNNTDAESHNDNDHLKSFNSDGFTMQGGSGRSNNNTVNFVAWQWKANGGTTTTNSAGANGADHESVYQANDTAGFSIVTYTSDSASGDTIMKHGLSTAPTFMIHKSRSATGIWWVYHKELTNDGYMHLESTNANQDGSTNVWRNTAPTSSVFKVGLNSIASSNETMVAYCFAPIQGFSKFGIYTGNGNANGPFVYTGFEPSYLMMKRTDSAGEWLIYDNKRDPFNLRDTRLEAQDNFADSTGTTKVFDFLSNGFKCRGSDTDINADDGTYIYMAFAEHPFVSSKGVPTTAR